MKRIVNWLPLFLFLLLFSVAHAEKLKTENVFLIMIDGFRWQEVFNGADEKMNDAAFGGVRNTNAFRNDFLRDTPEKRRELLLPFFWKEIAQHGQIFGNTNKGSIAHITNGKKFSYPGYNEVITGAADARIDSNDKVANPNTNVFEWLNQQSAFKGKTAVFGNWDVFPYIFNCERSRLPIWPAWGEKFADEIKISPEVNTIFKDTTTIWNGATMDSFIFHGALDYVKKEQPRVMFVGFGETDEWAHERRYDLYLAAAHHVDSFVQRLWETVQSMPRYRNKTTFIITCDHGRGIEGTDWKDHGRSIKGAENIWLAVLGPDTPALGERSNIQPIQQNQIASTLAAFLGKDFHAAFPRTGTPIQDVVGKEK